MQTASWNGFATEAPDLAARVWARFGASKHHVLATLRRDGSPRVSGTEVRLEDGELQLGMMQGSVKARDLQRDGRYALHANPGDGSMEGGDAKVSGVAEEVSVPASHEGPSAQWFRLKIAEVVLTSVHPDQDRLVIETWRPSEGARAIERR